MSCPLERLVSGLPSCLAQTPFYNRANEGNLAELDLLRTNEAVSASRNTHSADLLVLVGYFPNDAEVPIVAVNTLGRILLSATCGESSAYMYLI